MPYLAAAAVASVVVLAAFITFDRGGSVGGEPANQATPPPVLLPLGTSIFTVHHTYDDAAFIAITGPVGLATANGETCQVPNAAEESHVITQQAAWPFDHTPDECRTLGVNVRICQFEDFCSDPFLYRGQDQKVPIDWAAAPEPFQGTPVVKAIFSGPVTIKTWTYVAGGVVCTAGGTSPLSVRAVATFWPPPNRPECGGTGTAVTVHFDTVEHGSISSSFAWNGGDTDFRIQLPAPTPSPQPTVALDSAVFTVFFSQNGVPTFGPFPILSATSGGHDCSVGSTGLGSIGFSTLVEWPWRRQPAECAQIGVPVTLCVPPRVCSDEFIFDGSDETVWIDRPLGDSPFVTGYFKMNGLLATAMILRFQYWTGGQLCLELGGEVPLPDVPAFGNTWFLPGFPCSVIGAPITAVFTTEEYGDVTGSFVWSGESVEYDVILPPSASTASPTPAPTVTPTPTASPGPPAQPAALPRTGGQPR